MTTTMAANILAQGTFWLEPAASTSATEHDFVFHALLYITGFFFLLVLALMLSFIVLYRRRKGRTQAPGRRTTRRWN